VVATVAKKTHRKILQREMIIVYAMRKKEKENEKEDFIHALDLRDRY